MEGHSRVTRGQLPCALWDVANLVHIDPVERALCCFGSFESQELSRNSTARTNQEYLTPPRSHTKG